MGIPPAAALVVRPPLGGGNKKPYGPISLTLLAGVQLASRELAREATSGHREANDKVNDVLIRYRSLSLFGCSYLHGPRPGEVCASIVCVCYSRYLAFLFLHEHEIWGGTNTWSFICSLYCGGDKPE